MLLRGFLLRELNLGVLPRRYGYGGTTGIAAHPVLIGVLDLTCIVPCVDGVVARREILKLEMAGRLKDGSAPVAQRDDTAHRWLPIGVDYVSLDRTAVVGENDLDGSGRLRHGELTVQNVLAGERRALHVERPGGKR